MLSKYMQAPYIDTLFGLATPALIISVVYLSLLSVFLLVARKNGTIKIEYVKVNELMQGDRNKIIISLVGYGFYIFSCIYLPEFLGEDNIILSISETYLRFETLVFVLIFMFLGTALLNNTNRETHITTSNGILRILIWLSLGTGILDGQLDYTYWKNFVIIICSWGINVLFFLVKIVPVQGNTYNPERFDLIPYGAVNSPNDLFPSHKNQAEAIAEIISTSSSEPFSICLSGEWGTGKTSVINGAISLLQNNDNAPYDVIHINALELDNKKTVLTYLLTKIRENLKARGVYVGINSEYKEFVSSFTGSLTSEAMGTLLQSQLSNDEDYRAQKKNLEEIFELVYRNGKLVVIVDDIERCDKNTAREYLFLIKEVATMKGCVSVFVTDYNMLNGIVSNDGTTTSSPDFLNKFFNYKIDLLEEQPSDILAFYDGYFNQNDPSFWAIYKLICKSPSTWYKEAIAGLRANLQELEDDEKRCHYSQEDRKIKAHQVQQQKDCLMLFTRLLKNPRNVAKFYNVFRNHVRTCGKSLVLSSNSNEVTKYISSRNIGQVLYLLSFMEVFLPNEHKQLKKHGSQYIDPPLYGAITIEDLNKRLVVELAQGLIFGGYFKYGRVDGYIKADIRKFIKHYLAGNTNLHQLLNPFTSQEEEYLSAISQNDRPFIETHWLEMMMMVLQSVPSKENGITNNWRNDKFRFLLDFAASQAKSGNWTSDNLFSVFDSKLHSERYWAEGTGLMQIFLEHLENHPVYARPSKEKKEDFHEFISRYAYTRFGTVHKLMYYLIPLNVDTDQLKNIHENLLNSNNTLSQNIQRFLKKAATIIPEYSCSSEDWYINLVELTDKINALLVSQGIDKYSDVKHDVAHMMDTLKEFQCLEKVTAWIGEKNTVTGLPAITDHLDNLDAYIDYFERALTDQSSNAEEENELRRSFTNFFMNLQQCEGITLTKKQSDRLHRLIEKFVEEFYVSSLPYRRTLLNIPEKKP